MDRNHENTYTVALNEAAFFAAAFEELNIRSYELSCNKDKCIIRGHISHRLFKKAKRIAWVLQLSKETGVRHICRDEIDMNISGVIPEQELYFFKQHAL